MKIVITNSALIIYSRLARIDFIPYVTQSPIFYLSPSVSHEDNLERVIIQVVVATFFDILLFYVEDQKN